MDTRKLVQQSLILSDWYSEILTNVNTDRAIQPATVHTLQNVAYSVFFTANRGEKTQRILHFCTHSSQIYLIIPLFLHRHLLHFPKHWYPSIKFPSKNRFLLSFFIFFTWKDLSWLQALPDSSQIRTPSQTPIPKHHAHITDPSTRSLPSSCILSNVKWFYFLSI